MVWALLTLAGLAWLWHHNRTAATTADVAARVPRSMTSGQTVPSLGTCDRHLSALAKYVAVQRFDDGPFMFTLCGHCRVIHAKALYDQGWDVIDADDCDTEAVPA